jgi:hypothetical protein
MTIRDDLMDGLPEQMLGFGHNDFDQDKEQRHKCGEFYEEGFRPSQKMAVDTHAVSFPLRERRHANSHEFMRVLVGRIESLGVPRALLS